MSAKLTHTPQWHKGKIMGMTMWSCSAIGYQPKADGTPHVIQGACPETHYNDPTYRAAMERRIADLVEKTR